MSSTSSSNPILVIGATGRHGNTGEHLVSRLRAEGRAVRVLARTLSQRTDRLIKLGAEVVIGDLNNRHSLLPALANVDLAYFTYPVAAGVVSAAATYAAAVRQVGRFPRTVVMSMGPAQPDHPSELGKAQWLAEQVLDWAGLDLQILRVTALFHENLLVLHSRSIREQRAFRNSFGTTPMGWISGRDAAELGLAALLHPGRFDAPVTYPQGSEQFTHTQIAQMLSDVLGTRIEFTPVTENQWRHELIALSDADQNDVVNPAMAQHISSIGHAVSNNSRPTLPANPDALQKMIGRQPLGLRDFLETNRERFAPISNQRPLAQFAQRPREQPGSPAPKTAHER
jgi:uncharacterized protein YbjT (DUF2867 family)